MPKALRRRQSNVRLRITAKQSNTVLHVDAAEKAGLNARIMNPLRWIMHLDMDAFYASVEQSDNPELRGKPVVIGGTERGVVSTASYEARRFGVRSAMPMFQAKRLCPHAVFLRGRMERYAEKSREIMSLLDRFSPLVEKASIDEAYLDLTGLELVFGGAREAALAVQKAVFEETGLTCSAGLAPVKFLAKIASDMQKPAGFTVIAHEDVPAFMQTLPAAKIPGVGKQTLAVLERLAVTFAADVRRYPQGFWEERLGKAGTVLYERAFGRDDRPVVPFEAPKSESAENTFAEDTLDFETLTTWLLAQAERVGADLRRQNLEGRTVTLKIKYGDFTQHTKSRTLDRPVNATRVIYECAVELLREIAPNRPLRLIGVGVSRFERPQEQASLLPPSAKEEKNERDAKLDAVMDTLRQKFGKGAVRRGKLHPKGK